MAVELLAVSCPMQSNELNVRNSMLSKNVAAGMSQYQVLLLQGAHQAHSSSNI